MCVVLVALCLSRRWAPRLDESIVLGVTGGGGACNVPLPYMHAYIHTNIQTLDNAHSGQAQGLNMPYCHCVYDLLYSFRKIKQLTKKMTLFRFVLFNLLLIERLSDGFRLNECIRTLCARSAVFQRNYVRRIRRDALRK